MKAGFFCVFIFILEFFPSFSWGKECVFKQSQDILNCVLSRHPDIQEAETALRRDETLKKVARQQINPELESKVVTRDTTSGRVLNSETTIFNTLEIGGKRKARIFQAQAREQLGKANLWRMRENVVIETILTTNRLRQIQSEKHLIEENKETFNRILKHYQSRQLLSPEQQVASSVFETGSQEMSLKLSFLIQEETELKMNLELAMGISFKTFSHLLPKPHTTWPVLTQETDDKKTSSQKQQANAELDLAKAQAKMAKSDAWPNLRLGPTLETENLGHDGTILAGVSLELPLPFLSQNRAGKTYATLEEKRADIHYSFVIQKESIARQNQIHRYQHAVKTLQLLHNSPKNKLNHENRNSLFERGLVSSSLILEAHRQNLELIEIRHNQELNALEAFIKVLAIDGKISEAKL